jgi:hypothetical protein
MVNKCLMLDKKEERFVRNYLKICSLHIFSSGGSSFMSISHKKSKNRWALSILNYRKITIKNLRCLISYFFYNNFSRWSNSQSMAFLSTIKKQWRTLKNRKKNTLKKHIIYGNSQKENTFKIRQIWNF